jgi:hypothetical protein
MTATTAAARFIAVRAEGRYRVQDTLAAANDGPLYVAVTASKAKAEEKAAKLNAAEPVPFTAEENAALAAAEADELAAAQAAVDAEEAAREERAAMQADIIARSTELAAAVAPAAKPAKAKDDTVAYRIGKVLREWVLANDADSELAAYIITRNVCYDGTATLRVTAKCAQELSWLATDLENAAVKGDTRIAAAAKAPSIMAARAARKTLGNLFG